MSTVFSSPTTPVTTTVGSTVTDQPQKTTTGGSQPVTTSPPPAPDTVVGQKNTLQNLVASSLRVRGASNLFSSTGQIPEIPQKQLSWGEKRAYAKLEESSRKADKAMQELAKLNPADLAAVLKADAQKGGKRLSSEQKKILETYKGAITAQYALSKALGDCQSLRTNSLAGRTEGNTELPTLSSLRTACAFRTGELINLGATLQSAEKSEGDMTSVLAGQRSAMHGSQVLLEPMKEKAQTLLDRIDTLSRDKDAMNPDDFSTEITRLTTELQQLRENCETAKAGKTHGTGKDAVTLIADAELFKDLDAHLLKAASRLQQLGGLTSLSAVVGMVDAMFQPLPLDPLKKAGLPGEMLQELQQCNAAIVTLREEIRQIVANSPSEGNTQLLQNKHAEIRQQQVKMQICRMKLTACAFSRTPDAIKTALVKNYREYGLPEPDDAAVTRLTQEIQDYAVQNKNRKPQATWAKMNTALLRSLSQEISPNRVRAEYNELKSALAKMQDRPYQSGAVIAGVFANRLNLPALVEASVRDIPWDQIDVLARPDQLVGSKDLGSGAVNTVKLCTYRNEFGEITRRVFKPEIPARRGLGHLCAHALGFDATTRIVSLNTATHGVADAIKCGQVVAKATVGQHEGRFGLFMNAAPGVEAHSFSSWEKPVAATEKGDKLTGPELAERLHDTNKLPEARGNLMRELCKLEWADILSGQSDRHAGNYLVHINPDTGAVAVTGIDNDASFGQHMIGAGKVRVGPETVAHLNSLCGGNSASFLVPSAPPPGTTLLLDKLPDTPRQLLDAVRDQYGFNNMSLPKYIDKETYDALMAVDATQYRTMLAKSITDPAALDAAVLRLEDAKRLAGELHGKGRVLEGDQWVVKSQEIHTTHVNECPLGRNRSLHSHLHSNFYVRDGFAALFRN